jgi:biopolymer transport protein ExbD
MDPLTRGQRNKIRRTAEAGARAADDGDTSEINVVDPRKAGDAPLRGIVDVVPFLDIITNVLMFVLATLAITFTATTETTPPRRAPRSTSEPALGLSILVVPEGFSLKARGGNVAPGCGDAGAGLAIPKAGGTYDYVALNACATKLKSSAPEFAEERDVVVSANPQIPYDVLIATLDAVRTSSSGDPLFPSVSFAVAR